MITIKLAVMVKMMIMVQMAIEFYLNFIQISGEPGPFTTAKNGQSFLNHMKTIIEINNVDSTSHFFMKNPRCWKVEEAVPQVQVTKTPTPPHPPINLYGPS